MRTLPAIDRAHCFATNVELERATVENDMVYLMERIRDIDKRSTDSLLDPEIRGNHRALGM